MVDFYGKTAPSGLEIESIHTARRLHCGHWFDDATMRFFGTRICAERRTHAGLLFVTGLEVRCGGRPGFPNGVPKLVRDLALSILCGAAHVE